MSKHTPGDWRFINRNTIATKTEIIAVINQDKTFEEFEANAHLIAAAPELLKALKKIVKCEINRRNDLLTLANKPTDLYNFSNERVKLGLAAIAKAEGKADNTLMEFCELSTHLVSLLIANDIKTVGELRGITDSQFYKIKGIGRRRLREIRELLASVDGKLL